LKHHVFPVIGHVPIAEVRADQVRDLIKGMRKAKTHAPKTVHNVYGVIRAMYREAILAGLLSVSPCILKRPELGEAVDADAEWRPTAKFSGEERVTLISDERIPQDRRVLYALEGVARLRHGEAAGLRWRHVDTASKPLWGIVVATSYDTGRTKTKRTRTMPV